jgi:hypothetical protein
MQAQTDLDLGSIDVATNLILRAQNVTANITQIPASPASATPRLVLDITGFKGGLGTSAVLNVNAPAGLDVKQFKFIDATLTTTAANVAIEQGFVPGHLSLTTPTQIVLLDDRSSHPDLGNTVQLFQPHFAFTLNLGGQRLITDAFSVQYQVGSNVYEVLDGITYEGASFVRDLVRMSRNGTLSAETFVSTGLGSTSRIYWFGISPAAFLDIIQLPLSIEKLGDGPAVNIDVGDTAQLN